MIRRGSIVALALAVVQYYAHAQAGGAQPTCAVSGIISSGAVRLPGVAISATAADRLLAATASGPDGTYALRFTGEGTVVLRAELAAFAPAIRTIAIDTSTCQSRVDIALTLASRAPQTASANARGNPPTPTAASSVPRAAPQRPAPFQSLDLVADQPGMARPADQPTAPDPAAQLLLPPGFSPDMPTESITSVGNAGQFNEGLLFGPGRGDFPGGFGEGRGGPGGAEGGDAGRGGRGAFGGGRGEFGGRGFGPGGGGPAGRGGPGAPAFGGRLANERIRAQAFDTISGSMLDAAPYSLTGAPTTKSRYFQQRVGGSVGGPLKLAGSRTSFFVNYSGNHLSSPFDQYSTVPTRAARAGDLSAFGRPLMDPATGQPLPDNQIDPSRMNPASVALLALYPEPNQPGDRQNFHYVTTATTNNDDVNARIVRSFGTPQRGRGGRGGGAGGGRGGGRGGGVTNLNVGIHYRHGESTQNAPFPTIQGRTNTTAWDVPINYNVALDGISHAIRFQFSRNRSDTRNLYAFDRDVAGDAGLLGVSADPFDWGAPNLSFTTISSLRDVNPSMRIDRTLSIGDVMTRSAGRHTLRWGGDLRDQRLDTRTDPNARGSYIFTGLYTSAAGATGLDFADFLLGLPQQATLQFGPGVERFRARSWNLFLMDDWRVRANVTLNTGIRYEYAAPFREAAGRLVNLDVPPDFSAAVPVVAGETGPFSGGLPVSLVRPDRNNVAPRIGAAWRAQPRTVIRGGYGINYNAGGYAGIAQQLAVQPPFATTDTRIGGASSPLDFTRAFTARTAAITTNTFGIDPDYRLGYVQIWNVDVQREVTRAVVLSGGYTGTRGGDLDLLRAPNRGPTGLRIAGVQPFIWESSGGTSTMRAVTVRLRKRQTRGYSMGGAYTLSKSIDNASSIGGGSTVAQNDQDLEAERGPSSFDQRHRFNADFSYELPFGPQRRWLSGDGVLSQALRGWMWSGDVQLASGLPFTARVLGDTRDVGRGTNGSLRADYTGAPIAIDHPSILQFFNTAAFAIPAPGTFGSAGRNSIRGPGQANVNMALTKNVTLKDGRGFSLRVQANNVLNRPQFSAIDTVVNSPTFGRVIGVRPMRTVQIVARVRF